MPSNILLTRAQLTSSIFNSDSGEGGGEGGGDCIYLGKHKINKKSWTRKLPRNEVLRRRGRT
jgi:hypothetical protein